jgi:O-antigen/teichoic acid export membrane protein
MGIVLSIMGFAEIFSQVGVGPALVQRKEVHQQHINGAFYTAVILGAGFSLMFVFAAPLFAKIWGQPELEPIIQVVCSSFLISALAVVPRSLMVREMKFKTMFIASMISIVGGNLVVGLVLAYMKWNVWAYVWALFAQNTLMTLALWYYHPIKITLKWELKYTRELIRYGAGSTLFNALNYIATKVDVLMVPYFAKQVPLELRDEQLRRSAMYERSNFVMSLPITIMGKLSDSILFSGMSRLQEEDAKLRKTILIATNLVSIIIIPATVFISFYSKEIILLWLGDKYADAIPILQILFAAVIFRSLSKLGDSLLRAKDAVYRGSWYKAVNVVLMAIGIYIAFPYGMNFVALSVVLTTFIHYLMNMHLCTQLIGVKWKELFQALLPGIKLSGIIAFFCFLLTQIFGWMDIGPFISLITGVLFIGIFTVAYLFNNPKEMGHSEINPLQYLPQKLRSNKWVKQMIGRLS